MRHCVRLLHLGLYTAFTFAKLVLVPRFITAFSAKMQHITVDFTTLMIIDLHVHWFFSERELMFMFAICRHPSVCLSSVCLSVVCNVRAPYSGD